MKTFYKHNHKKGRPKRIIPFTKKEYDNLTPGQKYYYKYKRSDLLININNISYSLSINIHLLNTKNIYNQVASISVNDLTKIEYPVPGDGNCLFTSFSLGILLPFINDNINFIKYFNKLTVKNDDIIDIIKINNVKEILIDYLNKKDPKVLCDKKIYTIISYSF